MKWVLLVLGVAGLAVAGRRRVFVIQVHGLSMSPTYADGDRIIAVRTRRVRPGDLVAFQLPPAAYDLVEPADRDRPMVKRAVAVNGVEVDVRGDAPRSLDSTVFGPVPLDRVIGRGVRRLARRAAIAG